MSDMNKIMRRSKQDNEADLRTQAILCVWKTYQFEDAIRIVKRLLRFKPGHPLCYLILSDCYKGIAKRDNDFKASEQSETYADTVFAADGKLMSTDYCLQAIEQAAVYIVKTQNLAKLKRVAEDKLQELATKQATFSERLDVEMWMQCVSEDPEARIAYWTKSLFEAKAGFNQRLYGFDSHGKLVTPTREGMALARLRDPHGEVRLALAVKDPTTGTEIRHVFSVFKHLKSDLPTESVLKARARRKRYYDSHRDERLEYQKRYDATRKQRKRVRNKLDHSWRKDGLTHRYDTSYKDSPE